MDRLTHPEQTLPLFTVVRRKAGIARLLYGAPEIQKERDSAGRHRLLPEWLLTQLLAADLVQEGKQVGERAELDRSIYGQFEAGDTRANAVPAAVEPGVAKLMSHPAVPVGRTRLVEDAGSPWHLPGEAITIA